jgi:hypothetical protein
MTLENAGRTPEMSRDTCIAQNVECCIQAFCGRKELKGLVKGVGDYATAVYAYFLLTVLRRCVSIINSLRSLNDMALKFMR